MIGTKARGLRHAVRLTHGEPTNILYFSEGNSYPREGTLCVIGDDVYLFNDEVHNTRHLNSHAAEDLMVKCGHHQILCFDRKHFIKNEYASLFKTIYLLSSDFDKQFSEFLNANKKLFGDLSRKVGFSSLTNPFSKYIYIITEGSKNFFQWAHLCRARGVSIVTIDQILRWGNNYQQLAKNLKKGSITAYTDSRELFALMDEQIVLRREKRVANTINMFNTTQKKLLKALPFSDDMYNVMSRFNRLSDVKKNNFIRKMSTVDDANEIIHQMSFLVDYHFKWNKEAFLEYINNNEMVSAEVVYDKDDIVLVRVEDYDTIKRIAKNTSWCISKNKTYWNNYMSKSHIAAGVRQYVLFDFSKPEDDERSIVGFTLSNKKGITASHDFVNRNILDRKFSMMAYLKKRFNTLAPKKSVTGGIHAILIDKGIDISSLFKTGKIPYLWNAESLIKHLSSCLGGDDTFDILSDIDGRMAILVENDKIAKFLGERYVNNVSEDLWGNEHIIFADFNELADSPNKLLYGIIELNNNTKEWCCNVIRNENSDAMPISFDGLLDEYDLPYDIICRSDDKYDRVINAFGSYDINTVREFIGDESVIKHLRAKNDWTIICNSLSYSISTLISDEYLKAIYDNNVSLGDLLTDDGINIICGNLMSMITRKNFMPKEEEFAKLFERDGSLDNYTAESLAGCYMLKLIFDNEKGNHAFDVIKGVFIHNGGMRHPFIKDLMVKDKMGKEAVSYSTSVKKGSPF